MTDTDRQKKKRILFVEENVDGTIGGSQRVLLEVLGHLDREKFEPLTFFYQSHTLIPAFEKQSRVFIETAGVTKFAERLRPHIGRIPGVWHLVRTAQKAYNFLRHVVPWFLRLTTVLRRERIDLVCLNNTPSSTVWLLACKLMRRKCVSFFRATPTIPASTGRLMHHYDAVLSISNAVTENVRAQGYPTDNFILVYDGIDADAVRRQRRRSTEEVRAEFLPPFQYLIGVVNNIKWWKGQHVVVEAMHHLRGRRSDIRCLLVGDVSKDDMPYREKIDGLIRDHELKDSVILTGVRSDVPDILSALDLVIHTSVTNEGFPRIILESMVLGCPLVVSNSGPNVEMVLDGESGLVVPAGDSRALADAIHKALSDKELCAKFGANARARAEEFFDIDTNVARTEQLFLDVLEKGKYSARMA